METEQLLNTNISGGDGAYQEFFRILAEMVANSVTQDLNGSDTV